MKTAKHENRDSLQRIGNALIFASADPAWPWWGVSARNRQTTWFASYHKALEFAKTI